ncbi:TOPRIM nucleotidyl transferase/hydrolase domain-containing protein, partial [Escherichia coli]|uniref:TOPRIM nucleotidyl transferase/hydrolase domain-containing protein n=1 Tax=Escherichia coli TaxID=562 RepID=UPI0039F65FFD
LIMAVKKFAIILVEGDTEKALFQDFKTLLGYPIKKIVIANLWNVNINKYMPALTENSEIIVVFDTDRIENLDRFKNNLNLLKAKKHTIHLFQQTSNFEDELA